MTVKKRQVVLGVTGSIAVYKSADLIRRLQEQNFTVKVIMTTEAERFITPLTLATLSQDRVYRNMFDGQEDASLQMRLEAFVEQARQRTQGLTIDDGRLAIERNLKA